MNEIYLLLAVLIGFYLGRFNEVNKKVKEKLEKYKEDKEPFVIRTDEAELEREQNKAKENKDKIFLKDIFPETDNNTTSGLKL